MLRCQVKCKVFQQLRRIPLNIWESGMTILFVTKNNIFSTKKQTDEWLMNDRMIRTTRQIEMLNLPAWAATKSNVVTYSKRFH